MGCPVLQASASSLCDAFFPSPESLFLLLPSLRSAQQQGQEWRVNWSVVQDTAPGCVTLESEPLRTEALKCYWGSSPSSCPRRTDGSCDVLQPGQGPIRFQPIPVATCHSSHVTTRNILNQYLLRFLRSGSWPKALASLNLW